MIIRKLNLKDTALLLNYLKPLQTECLFIYSNLKMAGIAYQGEPFQGEYYAAFNHDESIILGVIVHYWNGVIMLHGRPNQILRSLCLYLKKHTLRPISGIIGLEEMAQELIAEFKWNSNDFKLNHSEGLFKLELKDLKSRSLPDDLNLINLVDAPKPIIIEWMKAYEIEALAGTIDENLSSKAEEKYQQMLKLSAWVLLKNNLPVSLCGFNAQVEDICQLGPVWTPPEHRNLGYAKYCVGQALVQEKNKGYQHSLLFTENPAAEKVYITLGFKKFNRFCLAFLKKEMHVE